MLTGTRDLTTFEPLAIFTSDAPPADDDYPAHVPAALTLRDGEGGGSGGSGGGLDLGLDPPPEDPPPAEGGGEGGGDPPVVVDGGSGGSLQDTLNEQVQERLKEMLPNIQAQLRRSIEGEFDRRYGARFKDLNELEHLRKKDSDRSRKEMEDKGAYEKARAQMQEQHKTELTRREEREDLLQGRLRENLINSAVVAAASRAYNPSQVAQLLNPKIKLDTETLDISVADNDGNPVFDKTGKPLSNVKELVDAFLEENPHFVPPAQPTLKSSGAAGSGDDDRAGDPEIAKLETTYKEAMERAARSNATPDVVQAHAAKRALDQARKDRATRRAA